MFDAGKTRMIGLPYGGKTVTIRKAVLIDIPACHGQMDGLTDIHTELLYQYRVSVC